MSYDAYQSRILEFLVNSGGRALRTEIQEELGIPRSSMTDVMKDMVSKGLVKVFPTFGNKTYWEITLEGKKVYQYGVEPIPDYRLPSIVEAYLEKKPKFRNFRPIQDTFIRRGLIISKHHVTVFGPPASGKTLIAEMTMVKELQKGGKILYATPYKALDRQKFKDFQTFTKFGFPVVVTDGDHPVSQEVLRKAPVIIATYERAFGAIGAREEWLKDISLVCADEITLLGEDRGATIDSLLTLCMTALPSSPRIITLSSHVGNKFQIARWLQAQPVIEDIYHDIEEFVVYRDGDHIVLWKKNGEKKPVKTERTIVEYLIKQNIIRGETTLVFVKTRWETEAIAEILKNLREIPTSNEVGKKVQQCFDRLEEQTPLSSKLCELLKAGVGFHHAGLQMEMRNLVEDLLQERKIKTVVCTTTLSHGIDYPVDNVIVFLSGLKNRWELDSYVCIQLEGRAGRPGKSQADKIPGKGRAFLITEKDDATRCMEKYIFGKPEAVRPDTLSDDNIARLILVTIGIFKSRTMSAMDIADVVTKTLGVADVSNSRGVVRSIGRILKKLEVNGMIKRKKGKVVIAELGEFMNVINISPNDASLVLNTLKTPRMSRTIFRKRSVQIEEQKQADFPDFGILHLACCIDVAKKVREIGSLFPFIFPKEKKLTTIVSLSAIDKKDFYNGLLKALVLKDWINEVPLGEISARYTGYDDHDVYELGMYASRSLAKISQIARRLKIDKLAERAEELSVRCRFGVKFDLAQSRIPFLKGIGRVRGRLLLENGFDLEKLSKSTRKLTFVLKDPELRRSVVVQSREMIGNEGI